MSPKRPSSQSSRSQTESGALGLYVHFPFCLRKCAYCDFASVALDEAGGMPAARRYLEALFVEVDGRAMSDEFYGAPVRTVYLGGGTPTVLPTDWIAELLTRLRYRFPFEPNAEITIEANPGTVNEEQVAALLSGGVNRLSLGVQSLSDEVLRTLGRVHSAAEALAAIEGARAAGGANLSLDLMFGIPEQSMPQWQETLQETVGIRPEHVSLYALSVEPGTPLSCSISAGELPAPDDDLAADMYETARETLTRAGYEHYEISNFARPSSQCRHNRIYWADEEYLGLGASAHSFRGGIRWNNSADPGVYMEWIERGRLPVARAERLCAVERVGEMLMLGLRRAEGASSAEIAARCGRSPEELFGEEIERLCRGGMLLAEDGILRISPEKWLVSNEVLRRFVR
jgi:oxygen-independent coproporphyrinogen-3 oxidase